MHLKAQWYYNLKLHLCFCSTFCKGSFSLFNIWCLFIHVTNTNEGLFSGNNNNLKALNSWEDLKISHIMLTIWLLYKSIKSKCVTFFASMYSIHICTPNLKDLSSFNDFPHLRNTCFILVLDVVVQNTVKYELKTECCQMEK